MCRERDTRPTRHTSHTMTHSRGTIDHITIMQFHFNIREKSLDKLPQYSDDESSLNRLIDDAVEAFDDELYLETDRGNFAMHIGVVSGDKSMEDVSKMIKQQLAENKEAEYNIGAITRDCKKDGLNYVVTMGLRQVENKIMVCLMMIRNFMVRL